MPRRNGRAGTVVRRCLAAVLVAGFAVVCLRLGWWQWQRFQQPGGSAQNLGYTLQWPTFALFAFFMWWRLAKLEARRRAERATAPAEPDPRPEPTAEPTRPAAARPANSADPADPEDELAAYNHYLAQLHAKEQRSAS